MDTLWQQRDVDLETLVALSVFRLGADTRGARLFWQTIAPDAQPAVTLLTRLADALAVPPGEQGAQIARALRRSHAAVKEAKARGLHAVTVFDRGYPEWLRQIPDPPIVLWVRGETAALNLPAVALVGARAASPAGLAVASSLGRDLARAKLAVTSGLARGIDAAAHRGALEAGGRTVAVLGCGAEEVYPREHADLADDIVAAGGAIASEFPPGTPPFPSHFPLRNRIISGLSRAVVVVEAAEKSGSLITARAGLEQGRPVLAVPGPVGPGRHRGCHGLIKDGARLVETVADVLEEIGWGQPPGRGLDGSNKSFTFNDLRDSMVRGEALALDDLVGRTGRPAAELLAELGTLELDGSIGRGPGGTFTRLD